MADSDQAHRREALQLKKARQAEEGREAMAEYQANALAVRKQTAKLRALRLARESVDNATAGSVDKPVQKRARKAS